MQKIGETAEVWLFRRNCRSMAVSPKLPLLCYQAEWRVNLSPLEIMAGLTTSAPGIALPYLLTSTVLLDNRDKTFLFFNILDCKLLISIVNYRLIYNLKIGKFYTI